VPEHPVEFLRLRDVKQRAGLSRSEIYRRIAAGRFPQPRKYPGTTMTFWLSTEVQAWQQEQLR
jgi:predicted DNA-binding transcriptional regulator AlpA